MVLACIEKFHISHTHHYYFCDLRLTKMERRGTLERYEIKGHYDRLEGKKSFLLEILGFCGSEVASHLA